MPLCGSASLHLCAFALKISQRRLAVGVGQAQQAVADTAFWLVFALISGR
jgi:hypothetical protein